MSVLSFLVSSFLFPCHAVVEFDGLDFIEGGYLPGVGWFEHIFILILTRVWVLIEYFDPSYLFMVDHLKSANLNVKSRLVYARSKEKLIFHPWVNS